jgi:hypothetical protein
MRAAAIKKLDGQIISWHGTAMKQFSLPKNRLYS